MPLSDNALAVLKTMNACRLGECIFPGSKGTAPLSDMTLGAVLRRMGVDVTVHGFRSTFRDWAAEETNYPNEMAEMALAHTIGNAVEAAYRRGNLLEKRHHMMADWARYCANPTPVRRVIPMPVRSATK